MDPQPVDIQTVKIELMRVTGAGGVFAWRWPELVPAIIVNLVIDLTIPSTAQATISFGVTPDVGTPSGNLIDGLNACVAGVFDAGSDHGTHGKTRQKLDSGHYVTGSASGPVPSMVGYAYITYLSTTT